MKIKFLKPYGVASIILTVLTKGSYSFLRAHLKSLINILCS
jgi:hypothetical protein